MSELCSRCCKKESATTEELSSLVDGSHSNEPVEEITLPHKDYESLDYDYCCNKPYEDLMNQHNNDKYFHTKLEVVRWIVTFFIGFFTAMVALFIDSIVKQLSNLKFTTVENSITQCSKDGCLVLSLLLLLAFNASFVFIASILTSIEPIAAGSGIPEIKCYLNGIKVPRVVRLKTLVSKAVGVLFSVAGGLFVGKEGPMIHSGAIIGAGVPQFQSVALPKINFNYPFFRTDRDKRDFVSGGAAAGVAAAFGAPIGGVLFSLEEGSSFWNQQLTWRTFFCSMAATFSLNFFLSGLNRNSWGFFYLPGLIDFGTFKCAANSSTCNLWTAEDLGIFLIMGFVGGLLGALFNALNKSLTVHRMKYVHKKGKIFRILEALLVAMVTTTVAFVAAMTLGECKKLPETDSLINGGNSTSSTISDSVRTYFCPKGTYNDMATLFFNPQEVAIKQLFHQEGAFSMSSLGIFVICFFFLACWTYGAAVPSGLFVPCLLCGAAYGRFVATLLVNVLGYTKIYSGTFALVGAAAFLGGVVRMTISLTVILIESTNEISYGLPIMIVLMVAKWSGDLFNEGLYDIHIELRNVPLLGWQSPHNMDRIKARDIMNTSLNYIFPHTRIQSIIQKLRTTQHHAFPVVTIDTKMEESIPTQEDMLTLQNIRYRNTSLLTRMGEHRRRRFHTVSEEPMTSQHWQDDLSEGYRNIKQEEDGVYSLRFHGLILRNHLVMLLKKHVCYSYSGVGQQRLLSYQELTQDYPRFPDIFDINPDQLDQTLIVDVTPYMNPSPYVVSPQSTVPQVFNVFRSMGLRHLPVINHQGQIVGIITRHNLTHGYLERCTHTTRSTEPSS